MSDPLGGLQDGKVGKVPVWAIGVLLAGGFVLFMYMRNRRSAKTANTPIAQDATTDQTAYDGSQDVSGLPPGAIGDYLNNNPTNPSYPVGLTPNGIPGPVTNVQWSRLAMDYLLGQGNDPALVERALAKYIQGVSLTQSEQSIVNLAQRAFGAPPEGLILLTPGDNTPPTPTPPQPGGALPAPTGVRTTGPVWTSFLEVHWDAVPGAVSYVVRGAEGDKNTAGPITATMVPGLVHNGTYFISVAAKDSSGNIGTFSQPITAHTKN